VFFIYPNIALISMECEYPGESKNTRGILKMANGFPARIS